MALSDYLTGKEWDACFYASFGKSEALDFGVSMHKTIDCLLLNGYKFLGLTETGEKKQQVENGINAPKICIFLGNPYGCNILDILDSGRGFLKENAPSLVNETDSQWDKLKKEAY